MNNVNTFPENCRERLRMSGKPYPRSGCAVCKTGGLRGCPYKEYIPETPPDGYAIIEPDGRIGYTVTRNRTMPIERAEAIALQHLHEHISDAINMDIEGAGQWVIRPLTIGPRPEPKRKVDLTITAETIRVNGYSKHRGSPWVPRVDRGVQIIHLPTGIVIEEDDHRSQHKNKAVALDRLKSRLKHYCLKPHQCHCGLGPLSPHEIGDGGCQRKMAEAPIHHPEEDDPHREWEVGGGFVSDYTLREQRGYVKHTCGCWSKASESTNSLPDNFG